MSNTNKIFVFVKANFLFLLVFIFFLFSFFNFYLNLVKHENQKDYRRIVGRETILDIKALDSDLNNKASTTEEKYIIWNKIANDSSANIDERVFAQDAIYREIFMKQKQSLNDQKVREMVNFYAKNSVDRNLTDNARAMFVLDISNLLLFLPNYNDLIISVLSQNNPYGGFLQTFKTRGSIINGLYQMAYDTYRSADNFNLLMFISLKKYEHETKTDIKNDRLSSVKNLLSNKEVIKDIADKYKNLSEIEVQDTFFFYYFLNLISLTENNIEDNSQEIERLIPLIKKFDQSNLGYSSDRYMIYYSLAKYYLYKKDTENTKTYILKMDSKDKFDSGVLVLFKYYTFLDADKHRFQKIVPEFMQ